jgi:hypothetical protein
MHLALFAAALFAATVAASPAQPPDRVPILAWGGPPQDQTTVERYRELAECGFTHNYSGFSSADQVAKALDVADAAGIKLIPSWPELSKDPEASANRFKNHRALGGYYLRDEPPATLFPELAAWAKKVQAQDPVHPCYLNLFPNYATPDQLAAPTYQAYVDRFVAEVPAPFLSFDHYPVVGQSLRGEWYQNLEIVSAAARKANKPFWAFVLSVAHGPYPVATLPHLRVQAFSNLAYGAQGLQYFTYWTVPSSEWNFHEGPILPDGKRGAVYDRVKQVNHEVQSLGGVFLGSTVTSVGHTGANLPAGTRKYQPSAPVKSLTTDGQGAVVSLLSKRSRRFLVVVNRDINKPMRLAVEFDPNAAAVRVGKDETAVPVDAAGAKADVEPGDLAVFAWDSH